MKITLDIVAGWIALDVVLIVAWHLAHVSNRHAGRLIQSSGPDTQRVFTVAPEAARSLRLVPVPARTRSTHRPTPVRSH